MRLENRGQLRLADVKGEVVMTHVADDAMIGKFVRRIKGLVERAMAGSLDIEKLWNIVQGYLDGKLTNIEGVLSGSHRIVEIEKPVAIFTLDTTNASMPQSWKDAGLRVEEHKSLGIITIRFVDGEMYIDDRKVGEYIAEEQKTDMVVGNELRKKLAGEPTLPDAVLDLLIREQVNPAVKLFLQRYEGRHPIFWSTIYRNQVGNFFVRYLGGGGERFGWDGGWLDDVWDAGCPALVLAPLPSESGT